MRVLLVTMPWANPSFPNLALGLLRSVLEADAIGCDVLYANVLGATLFGDLDTYDAFSTALASELVFSPLYDAAADRRATARRLSSELSGGPRAPNGDEEYFLGVLRWAEELIDRVVDSVEWEQYSVVGFSLSFQQTTASLALARAVKRRHPSVQILFGGASCDGEMGLEMLRAFPELDYVFIGEADGWIVRAVREIEQRRGDPSRTVTTPGLAGRGPGGQVVSNGTAPFTRDLDALPLPDFGDYFSLLDSLGSHGIQPRLYVEHSRGCWYGEHRACSFCGLSEMAYRRKSPRRALDELLELSRRHRSSDFYMSDNILDFRYFQNLLPEVARLRHEEGFDLTLFYEVKSNLSRRHVELLAAAGVTMVQIGIESFDEHVLELMRKGSKVAHQVQSLKHLYEHGIHAVWNILYGNPGERPEDYDRMADLFGVIDCLPPPSAGQVGPMVLQRFSRYFRAPESFGIRDVRPDPVYGEIFPSDGVDLDRLACFFVYEHDDHHDRALLAARRRMLDAVEGWRERHRPHSLTFERGPGWIQVHDRRDGRERLERLEGLPAAILSYCDSHRSEAKIRSRFREVARGDEIEEVVKRLVDERWMVRAGGEQYVSLPIRSRHGTL